MKILPLHLLSTLVFCVFLSFQANTKVVAPQSLILHCPSDRYISCTEDLYHLSRFGNATYTIGNYTYTAGMPVVTYHLNSCNAGYITRTWNIEDPYWNWHTCTQTIYVSSGNNNNFHVNWPPDYEVEGCNPNVKPHQLPAPYNSPTWSGDECRMIGKSYTDMVFTVNNGCKKIMRMWKLIDWCDNNGFGTQWTHTQIIKIINEERPTFDCPADITIKAINCKNARLEVPSLVVGATSCGGAAVVSNNSPYADNKGANISGVYPIGTTKVTYTIQYGCGSRAFCTRNVVVQDGSKPSAYCLHSLATALMPIDTNQDGTPDDGMVEIWAKDLDRGSKSLCNYNPLRFSFSPDPTDMSKTFTCDEVGKNEILIYITDSKGGQSACMVNIDVQNNSANIPDCTRKVDVPVDTLNISHSGKIVDMFGQKMEDVSLSLTFNKPNQTITVSQDSVEIIKRDSFYNASGYLLYFFRREWVVTTTSDTVTEFVRWNTKSDSTGSFVFKGEKRNDGAYSLTASFGIANKNQIDGKDVEWLTKYLLGEITSVTPYQLLAADVDGNKTVDINDLNVLISYVTGSISNLPVSPYIFVNKKDVFEPATSVFNFDFTKTIRHAGFITNYSDHEIIGIKIGNITNETGLESENDITQNRSGLKACKVYPNPSIDQLNIEISEKSVFNLKNIQGDMILQNIILEPGIHNLWSGNLSDLPTGIYVYSIQNQGVTLSGKWIKL